MAEYVFMQLSSHICRMVKLPATAMGYGHRSHNEKCGFNLWKTMKNLWKIHDSYGGTPMKIDGLFHAKSHL